MRVIRVCIYDIDSQTFPLTVIAENLKKSEAEKMAIELNSTLPERSPIAYAVDYDLPKTKEKAFNGRPIQKTLLR